METEALTGYEAGLFSPTVNLLIVMVLIWTTGVLFRKFSQPPVLGELLAGIIFGPPVLGIITPDPTLDVLADLGVFFLMFYAGLETNPLDLKRYGKPSFTVGFAGFLIPLLMGYMVSVYGFGLNHLEASFVGLGLSITAIAVNARVLNDLYLQDFRVTPVILGASIIDDVLSLALLSALIGFVHNGVLGWVSFWQVMFKTLVFFAASIFIGMKVYPFISQYFATREAKGFTFALIIAMIFGLMAELAGLHLIIGAYMAGLFVREGIIDKDLFQKIKDRFVSITYGFLGPIFFVSLSFHITFGIFRTHLGLIIILFIVAVLGKLMGAGLGARIGKMNYWESAVIGFAMNGRGAVELIIASIGLEMGIINDELFSILVVIAFLTTFMPPASLGILIKRIHARGNNLLIRL